MATLKEKESATLEEKEGLAKKGEQQYLSDLETSEGLPFTDREKMP